MHCWIALGHEGNLKMVFRILLLVLISGSLCWLPAVSATEGKVQVGYCSRLAEIDAAKAAGFDYVELRTSEIVALSDADYEKLAVKLKQLKLPVPVTFLFIPASIKITGPKVDREEQMRYVRKAFDRVSRLGA